MTEEVTMIKNKTTEKQRVKVKTLLRASRLFLEWEYSEELGRDIRKHFRTLSAYEKVFLKVYDIQKGAERQLQAGVQREQNVKVEQKN